MTAPDAILGEAGLRRRSAAGELWALVGWLGVQMLVLLAAALRAPFSARFPSPEDQLAVHEMLVVQMLGSALLFPVLFRSAATGAMVVAGAGVMVQLSAILAAMVEFEKLVAAMAYACLWLVGLGLWSAGLRGNRARMYGAAAASALVGGGAVVAYLGREFGAPAQSFDWAARGYLGPLVGGMALLEAGARTGTAWIFLGAFVLSGALAAGFGRKRGRAGVWAS